jgi:multidrug transporter EmrE-like cation transporter
MTATAFALILTGVMLNAAAQLLLKAGVQTTGQIGLGAAQLWGSLRALAFEPYILSGLACYAVSVVVWVLALSRVPVSVAYPLLSMGYIVTAIAAWQLFGEQLGTTRVVGIAVIIVGVVLVTRS